MELEYLRKIGLTSGEIKVYSAVLEIGASSLNKIHEKTGIERRNIYDILNKLIEKGLVSYVIERGKALIIVVNKWDLVKKENKNTKDAEREIKLWFEPDEIVDKIFPIKESETSIKKTIWK